jgi:hypothetical protein
MSERNNNEAGVRDVSWTVRLDAGLGAELDSIVQRSGVKKADLSRLALRHYVDEVDFLGHLPIPPIPPVPVANVECAASEGRQA